MVQLNILLYMCKQNHQLNNLRYSTPNIQRLSLAYIMVT